MNIIFNINVVTHCCIDFFIFSGLVPLHNACSYGHFEVTELLIKVCVMRSLIKDNCLVTKIE